MKHSSRFRRGDLVRYVGRDGDTSRRFLVGCIARVMHVEERARWTGPRTLWPASHVLTREDLEAGHALPDQGWSWDPPEFVLFSISANGLTIAFVDSEFELAGESELERQRWEETDAHERALATTLARLELICSWARFERNRGVPPMEALRRARHALEELEGDGR